MKCEYYGNESDILFIFTIKFLISKRIQGIYTNQISHQFLSLMQICTNTNQLKSLYKSQSNFTIFGDVEQSSQWGNGA
jgi:hypothetical protein